MAETVEREVQTLDVCEEKHKGIDKKLESGDKKFEKLFDKIEEVGKANDKGIKEVGDCVSKKLSKFIYLLFIVLGGLIMNLIYLIMNNHKG